MRSHSHLCPPRGGILFLALFGLLMSGMTTAAYVPESADTVIAKLPPLRDAPPRISAGASQPEQLNIANEQIELAKRTGDLRHLGYAEKILEPIGEMSADAWVLRARIQQYRHRFDTALQALSRALTLRPGHRNALLQRAALLRTNGQLTAALDACRHLPDRDPARALCEWPIRSLQGELHTAIDALRSLSVREAPLRLWRDSELAEMHERAGDDALARTLWASVLAADPQDHFARRHLADNLLRAQQPAAVMNLIPEGSPHPGLVIARLQAQRALGGAGWKAKAEALVQRLERAQDLYGESHERELARIQLSLLDHPARALTLAVQNWRRQREPEDIRLLYRAARTTGQPDAARGAVQFVEKNALEDTRLHKAGDATT